MIRDSDPTILTRSGVHVTPLALEADLVRIEDIAHHLGNLCRFTGATSEFYSVAQHCVLVSELVSETNPEYALDALLHDGSEYVLNDLVRPLKWQPEFQSARDAQLRADAVIRQVFGLQDVEPAIVKECDLILLATEARDLMPHATDEWEIIQGVTPIDEIIVPWTPYLARETFLDRYNELTFQGGAE